jgi:NAD(P)-dependent dehydrogenase (short-subunit alcohol dehydrogenase family)
MEFTGKKVVITGANGLVGLPAVKKCLEEGAAKVYAVEIGRASCRERVSSIV